MVIRCCSFDYWRLWAFSADRESRVCGDVASDEGGQHAGLDFQHSAVAHLVAEDRVRDDRCLSLFVSLEEAFAAILGQLAGFAPDQEVLRRQDVVVDQRQHHRIGDDGPELLHQIQGQGWFAVPADVEEAVIGIEADGAQGGKAILQEQGVAEGKKGVDGITRRPAIAGLEIESDVLGPGS